MGCKMRVHQKRGHDGMGVYSLMEKAGYRRRGGGEERVPLFKIIVLGTSRIFG